MPIKLVTQYIIKNFHKHIDIQEEYHNSWNKNVGNLSIKWCDVGGGTTKTGGTGIIRIFKKVYTGGRISFCWNRNNKNFQENI